MITLKDCQEMRWRRRSSTASSKDSNSSKRGKSPGSSFRRGSDSHSISRSETSSSSNGTPSRRSLIVSSRSGTGTSSSDTSISIHSLERRNQEQADQEGKNVMQLYNYLRQKELRLYGDPPNVVLKENMGKRLGLRQRLKRFTGWRNRSAIRPSQSREPMDSCRSSWFGFTSIPSGTRDSNAVRHNAKFASRWSKPKHVNKRDPCTIQHSNSSSSHTDNIVSGPPQKFVRGKRYYQQASDTGTCCNTVSLVRDSQRHVWTVPKLNGYQAEEPCVTEKFQVGEAAEHVAGM
jgi:hypothetical protein